MNVGFGKHQARSGRRYTLENPPVTDAEAVVCLNLSQEYASMIDDWLKLGNAERAGHCKRQSIEYAELALRQLKRVRSWE